MLKKSNEIYREDLVILSETVSKINQRRIELSIIEESKRNAERDRDEAQLLKNKWEKEAEGKEERVASLTLLEESLIRHVDYLNGKIQEEELRLLTKKTLTDAEKNRLQLLKEVREKTNEEIKKLNINLVAGSEERRVNSEKIREEEVKLEKIKKESKEVLDNLKMEEARINQKRADQKREEAALDVIRKNMEIKRKRLQQFADDHGIQIKF